MAFNGPGLFGLSLFDLSNLPLILKPALLNRRKALPGVFTPYGHLGSFEIENIAAASITVKTHTAGVIKAATAQRTSREVMAARSATRETGNINIHGLSRLDERREKMARPSYSFKLSGMVNHGCPPSGCFGARAQGSGVRP